MATLERLLSARNGRWQSFSIAAIDPLRFPESGRWIGSAQHFGLEVGNAAGPVIGDGQSWDRKPARTLRWRSPSKAAGNSVRL